MGKREYRAPGWRHSRIIEVAAEAEGAWSFADADDLGRLWVGAEHGVTPRVGDTVSYYGHFGDDRLVIGHAIELLVIGERVVWDHRERWEERSDGNGQGH